MNNLRLLDLFCGAGGCSVGYQRSGFDCVGVDHRPQPRYPFPDRFQQGCALETLESLIGGGLVCGLRLADIDAIHASPPCQRYSAGTRIWPENAAERHPDLVGPTRELLDRSGKPWVIENVEGSPLSPFAPMLCGLQFGLKVFRHRLFESNIALFGMPHAEIVQAIPPAYTAFVGRQLIDYCRYLKKLA